MAFGTVHCCAWPATPVSICGSANETKEKTSVDRSARMDSFYVSEASCEAQFSVSGKNGSRANKHS